MSLLARLGVVLGLDSAQFKAGLDDATKSTKAFEAQTRKAMRESERAAKEFQAALKTMAAYAATAAATIGAAFKYADDIADTADAFDITVESLIAMQSALAGAGGKIENTANMLQKLSQNAEAAREGTDKARESFTKLGIAGADVENLAPDELFVRVAEALAKIEDPIKRNALAFEVLGKAAKGVDWKTYWEDYSKGKSSTEAVSQAVEDGAKAWDNLAKAGRAALQGLLVLIQPIAKFINFVAEKLGEADKRGLTGSSFDAEFGGAFGMDQGAGAESIAQPPKAIAGAKAKSTGGGYSTASDRERTERAATEAVRQQTIEYARQVGIAIKRQQMETEMLTMTQNQKEIYVEINKIEDQRSQILQNINKELEVELARGKDANKGKIAALREQIEVVNELKNAERQAVEEIIAARQQEQMSFASGWNRAFREYVEASQDASKFGEQAFSTVFGNMEAAIEQFVRTGKMSFKDLTQSIIQSLLIIQIRMQAMRLFGMMFPGMGMGTQAPAPITTLTIPAANGAEADAYQPYYIGERGPELFVPTTPGTIVPNHRISDVAGGQTYVTNNYIDAIDVKSFEDRLLSSSNTVWAANQYANKSLAQPGGRA